MKEPERSGGVSGADGSPAEVAAGERLWWRQEEKQVSSGEGQQGQAVGGGVLGL